MPLLIKMQILTNVPTSLFAAYKYKYKYKYKERLIKTQILTLVPTYFFAAYRTPQGANDLDYSLKRHAGKTPNKNYLNIAKNNTVLMIGGQTPEGMLSFCSIQVTATLGAGWLMQTTTSCLRQV